MFFALLVYMRVIKVNTQQLWNLVIISALIFPFKILETVELDYYENHGYPVATLNLILYDIGYTT